MRLCQRVPRTFFGLLVLFNRTCLNQAHIAYRVCTRAQTKCPAFLIWTCYKCPSFFLSIGQLFSPIAANDFRFALPPGDCPPLTCDIEKQPQWFMWHAWKNRARLVQLISLLSQVHCYYKECIFLLERILIWWQVWLLKTWMPFMPL